MKKNRWPGRVKILEKEIDSKLLRKIFWWNGCLFLVQFISLSFWERNFKNEGNYQNKVFAEIIFSRGKNFRFLPRVTKINWILFFGQKKSFPFFSSNLGKHLNMPDHRSEIWNLYLPPFVTIFSFSKKVVKTDKTIVL